MNNVITKFLLLPFLFACSFVLGCTQETPEKTTVSDSLLDRHPVVKTQQPPLNCPIMVSGKEITYEADRIKSKTLSPDPYWFIFLAENPNFDPELGDACQGDMKKIWPDLLRFEMEISEYWPNVRGVGGIHKYFPATLDETKQYIDQAAKVEKINEQIGSIDRSTLEGGLAVHSILIKFVREKERNYWIEEQGTIIESILSDYKVKVITYEAEKTSYCYHPYSICRSYYSPDIETSKDDYILEYLGSPFKWLEIAVP